MISALPGLLAQTLADKVNGVAGAGTIFAAPCRGVAGPVAFAPADTQAVVFAELGALTNEDSIGAVTAGEQIKLPFQAKVMVSLAGPETTDLSDVTRDPADLPIDWADMMLSVVTGHLQSASDAGRDAPISYSDVRTGTRRITAEWRFGRIVEVTPDLVERRNIWVIQAEFEGVQILSPIPAEGGIITRAELTAQVGAAPQVATIQGASEQLPLHLFLGIGPENAEKLASFGLVRVADLMRVPRAEIGSKASTIAGDDTDLRDGLVALHGLLMLRLDAVLGGLNAAHLKERHAALTLDAVWDGTTLTLPADMDDGQKLRVQFMALVLMRLIRPSDRTKVTLGQLSTLNAEGFL